MPIKTDPRKMILLAFAIAALLTVLLIPAGCGGPREQYRQAVEAHAGARNVAASLIQQGVVDDDATINAIEAADATAAAYLAEARRSLDGDGAGFEQHLAAARAAIEELQRVIRQQQTGAP